LRIETLEQMETLPGGNSTITPTLGVMTSFWSSTTQVEQSNGLNKLEHLLMMLA